MLEWRKARLSAVINLFGRAYRRQAGSRKPNVEVSGIRRLLVVDFQKRGEERDLLGQGPLQSIAITEPINRQ